MQYARPDTTIPPFERIGANGMPETVAMSKLFGRHRRLILYSFMYGPERDTPCPMCAHLLDSMNGGATHVDQRASLAIAAKSPLARLIAFARQRGWPVRVFPFRLGRVDCCAQ